MRPYSPGGILNALAAALGGSIPLTPSIHRLGRGLPGYLILFATHAFAPQRQEMSRRLPSPLVFLPISTHVTVTPGILSTSTFLQLASMRCSFRVEPWRFHTTLNKPPTRPLRPVNPDNACSLRITAAAGTELAGAYSPGTVLSLSWQKEFTDRNPSSSTRRRCIRVSPIVQDSQLLPPVGVWAVSQSHSGGSSSQTPYPS